MFFSRQMSDRQAKFKLTEGNLMQVADPRKRVAMQTMREGVYWTTETSSVEAVSNTCPIFRCFCWSLTVWEHLYVPKVYASCGSRQKIRYKTTITYPYHKGTPTCTLDHPPLSSFTINLIIKIQKIKRNKIDYRWACTKGFCRGWCRGQVTGGGHLVGFCRGCFQYPSYCCDELTTSWILIEQTYHYQALRFNLLSTALSTKAAYDQLDQRPAWSTPLDQPLHDIHFNH